MLLGFGGFTSTGKPDEKNAFPHAQSTETQIALSYRAAAFQTMQFILIALFAFLGLATAFTFPSSRFVGIKIASSTGKASNNLLKCFDIYFLQY